jgi:hypothetical protein
MITGSGVKEYAYRIEDFYPLFVDIGFDLTLEIRTKLNDWVVLLFKRNEKSHKNIKPEDIGP